MDVRFIKRSEKTYYFDTLNPHGNAHFTKWTIQLEFFFLINLGWNQTDCMLDILKNIQPFHVTFFLFNKSHFHDFLFLKSVYVLLMFGRILELRLFFDLSPYLILRSLILEKGKTLFWFNFIFSAENFRSALFREFFCIF